MTSSEPPRRPAAVAAGPIIGAIAALAISLISQRVTIVGTAILAGLGSIIGWALQDMFVRKDRAVPLLLLAISAAGVVATVLLLPAVQHAADTASPSTTSEVQPTTALRLPSSTMSFTKTPSSQVPDDHDGLVGIAKTNYGDPERLTIEYMDYDSAPAGRARTEIDVFTGRSAIALAQREWRWFAAGNSGDLHTEAVSAGDVHCTLHAQDNGTSGAECWRWDPKMALTIAGVDFPTGSENNLLASVEDLYLQTYKLNFGTAPTT